jgi:cyclophilin family peptidyl-prolyl cis-trans isomerase
MASVGVNTSGSQFYLSLNPCPHMDGRCVVFGRMVDPQSEATLQSIEKVRMFHCCALTLLYVAQFRNMCLIYCDTYDRITAGVYFPRNAIE